MSYVEQLLRSELEKNRPAPPAAVSAAASATVPSVVALSIALGALEAVLTVKDESAQQFPEAADLQASVDRLLAVWEAWLADMHAKLAAATAAGSALDTRAKVKLIADTVWSKLTAGSFSKDVLHAQHIFNFCALLLPPGVANVGGNGKAARRQLDCAGVVTTVYAAAQALAAQYDHADLACIRMHISEDHCWLQMAGPGASCEDQRLGSIEVTTVNPAQRGLLVAAAAWSGWLYCGGGAVLCDHRQALAAVVASLDPQVVPGKKGRDSERLQAVQWRLLSLLAEEAPDTLYPAAICALADLLEVERQDALDAALAAGDAAEVQRLLQRRPGDAQALFERAIAMDAVAEGAAAVAAGDVDGAPQAVQQQQQQHPDVAGGSLSEATAAAAGAPAVAPSPAGYCWYPHSYLAGFLFRQAEYLAKCVAGFPPPEGTALAGAAEAALRAGLAAAAAGAGVLARYRYNTSTDDQLYKDVEGAFEYCCDGLKALQQARQKAATADAAPAGSGKAAPALLEDPTLLAPLLTLWDGCCLLFAGRPKPSGWVGLVLKAAKLFTPAARAQAAAAVEPRSGPMRHAQRLWEQLKPAVLKPLFETVDMNTVELPSATGVSIGGSSSMAVEQSSGSRATKRQRA